ncbi:MAG: hypothetical protein Kow0063_30120 [Anaerolineae bacterium]
MGNMKNSRAITATMYRTICMMVLRVLRLISYLQPPDWPEYQPGEKNQGHCGHKAPGGDKEGQALHLGLGGASEHP